MLKPETSFNNMNQLIEDLYIIGLQKEAKELPSLADKKDFFEAIERDYQAKEPSSDKHWVGFKNEIGAGKSIALLGEKEYDFIAYSAYKLSSNSKILKIGTYHGGSTLALCEGSNFNKSRITSIDPFTGFEKFPIFDTDAMNWSQNLWQKM